MIPILLEGTVNPRTATAIELAEAAQRAQERLNHGDRAGAYLELYRATGIVQLLLQAQITTYAGAIGGMAIEGNYRAKQTSQANYTLTLDVFSYDIDTAVVRLARDLASNGDPGGFTAQAIQQTDARVWKDNGMADLFPGNAQQIYLDPAIANTPGGVNAILAQDEAELGRRPAEFANNPRYTTHTSADGRFITVVDNASLRIELFFDRQFDSTAETAAKDFTPDLDLEQIDNDVPSARILAERQIKMDFLQAGQLLPVAELATFDPDAIVPPDNFDRIFAYQGQYYQYDDRRALEIRGVDFGALLSAEEPSILSGVNYLASLLDTGEWLDRVLYDSDFDFPARQQVFAELRAQGVATPLSAADLSAYQAIRGTTGAAALLLPYQSPDRASDGIVAALWAPDTPLLWPDTRDHSDDLGPDFIDRLKPLLPGQSNQAVAAFVDSTNFASVSDLSAAEIAALAKTDIAWRYALRELNDFVITGVDYQGRFNADGSLNLYDPETGKGLTDAYLQDRSHFLSELLLTQQAGTPNIPFNSPHATSEEYFYDTATDTDLRSSRAAGGFSADAPPDPPADTPRILFGDDKDNSDLTGANAADRIYGAGGNDTLIGRLGDDYLEGGQGNDTLDGGADNDTLFGGRGQDTLIGGDGNDSFLIHGDDQSGPENNRAVYDRISGGKGLDTIFGGDGDDRIRLRFLSAADSIEFILAGAGEDRLVGTENADVIDLSATVLVDIEAVELGGADDQITLSTVPFAANYSGAIDGGAGNDSYFIRTAVTTGNGRAIRIHDTQGANRLFIDGKAIGNVTGGTNNTWTSADGQITVTRNSPLTITLNDDTRIILEDWQANDFGIHLIGAPTDPVATNTLSGDLAPADQDAGRDGLQLGTDDLGNLKTTDTASARADRLQGTDGDDIIRAGERKDIVLAGAGNDRLIRATHISQSGFRQQSFCGVAFATRQRSRGIREARTRHRKTQHARRNQIVLAA